MDEARRRLVTVPLKNGTLQHTVVGKHGATTVFMQPAPEGTGIIAGGPMRAVFEVMGIHNITANATARPIWVQPRARNLEWFAEYAYPEQIAAKRGKTVEEILGEVANG